MLEWAWFVGLTVFGAYHTFYGVCTVFMMYYLFKFRYTSIVGWVELVSGVLLLCLAWLVKPFQIVFGG